MNINTLKLLISIGVVALVGYLGLFVFRYTSDRERVEAPISEELLRKYLDPGETVEPARDDLVDYRAVTQAFIELDWTGRVEAVVVEEAPVEAPVEVVRTAPAIDELLVVLFIQVDVEEPEASIASVRYTDPRLVQSAAAEADAAAVRARPGSVPLPRVGNPPVQLTVGARLPAPFETVRVAVVEPGGLVFAFDDESWERQTVSPQSLETAVRITAAGPDGLLLLEQASLIPRISDPVPFRPKHTQLVGENRYRLGSDDARKIGDNYAEYLTRDVRYRPWRDPQTGRKAGIQLDKVEAGSILADHGAMEGDVIKSINGQPVSSVSEAITFVKNNAASTSVWEVVVTNKGVQRVVIYESPPAE